MYHWYLRFFPWIFSTFFFLSFRFPGESSKIVKVNAMDLVWRTEKKIPDYSDTVYVCKSRVCSVVSFIIFEEILLPSADSFQLFEKNILFLRIEGILRHPMIVRHFDTHFCRNFNSDDLIFEFRTKDFARSNAWPHYFVKNYFRSYFFANLILCNQFKKKKESKNRV